MRSLMLLMDPEGNSDFSLLSIVVRRVVIELCSHARYGVAVGEPNDTRSFIPQASRGPTRCLSAMKACGDATVLAFVHADGGSNACDAYTQHVHPVIAGLLADSAHQAVVGVVPVREMENWALADGRALAIALGISFNAQAWNACGWISPADKISDPKAVLNNIVDNELGKKWWRRNELNGVLAHIGEQVDLDCLRQLAAFSQFEKDTTKALKQLNIL